MSGLTDKERRAIKSIYAPPASGSRRKRRLRRSRLWNRPHYSDALGVHPNQIPQAREAARARGIALDFTRDGRAIITSDRQFREAAKATGVWNGRDGYGAPHPDGGYSLNGRQYGHLRQDTRRRLKG